MFTGTTNFDYRKRGFSKLPAGFRATNETYKAISGRLDIPALNLTNASGGTAVVRCGLMLVFATRPDNGINTFTLPTAASTAKDVAGILFFDETNYRFKNVQPEFTHNSGDLVTVIREGDMRVHKIGAIGANSDVYLIKDTTVTNELPGMLKATAGTNAVLLNNCRWAETTTDTGVGVVTLEILGGRLG